MRLAIEVEDETGDTSNTTKDTMAVSQPVSSAISNHVEAVSHTASPLRHHLSLEDRNLTNSAIYKALELSFVAESINQNIIPHTELEKTIS